MVVLDRTLPIEHLSNNTQEYGRGHAQRALDFPLKTLSYMEDDREIYIVTICDLHQLTSFHLFSKIFLPKTIFRVGTEEFCTVGMCHGQHIWEQFAPGCESMGKPWMQWRE